MREIGYYWVKYEGEWTVAKYIGDPSKWDGGWRLHQDEDYFADSNFEQIGEILCPPSA